MTLGTDGVSRKTLTIVDVVNLDLLIFVNIGSFQQGFINRTAAFIVQLAMRHTHPMQL